MGDAKDWAEEDKAMLRRLEGCASTKASCHCDLAPDHDGDHRCECGGQWDQRGRPTVLPYLWAFGPRKGQPLTEDETLVLALEAMMFAALGGGT